MTYEIRLIINRNEEGYTAKWVDFGGQESAPFELALPLGKAEADDLRWYLEEYIQLPGAGDHVKARNLEARLGDWGRRLFEAAFGTVEGTNVYRNLMDAVRDDQPGLITLGATDPDVLVQPWEMMRDTKGVLALRGVTLRRQLQGAKPAARFNFTLPLRILLIVSRPVDVGFIDPRNSIPPVLDACDALGGQVEVEFCDPPTLPQLEKMISQARKEKRPYHLIHFDGHGTYLPKTGVGALVFEDAEAKTDLVPGQRFGDLMSRFDIPLVLLEACRGSDLSDQPVFGSLAPALLDSGVGSVVAFSHSVHIRAARILVERFYQELSDGQSVGAALQEARAALRADPKRFIHLGPDAETVDLQDWFIPQLYQVGADPTLLPASTEHAPRTAAPVSPIALPGFPPAPQYRFHGRALELLEIERAFHRHNAVVVSGMGGMGKTALAREAAAWWRRIGRFEQAVFISFEQKAGVEYVVQRIGQALEGDDFSRRSGDEADPQGQWQSAVRLFHEQRALVVWDNFESTLSIYQNSHLPVGAPLTGAGGQGEGEASSLTTYTSEDRLALTALYRALTEGTPHGRLLVTCRPQETGLPGIKEYPLEGLKRPDSLGLLAAALDVKGISLDRDNYERPELDALLDLLADHPLSIELIAPHLKTLTPAEIRRDFAALLERFANDDALEGRNRSLRASLEFSRQRLSPPAQDILPFLAWFEGGVFERFLLDFTNLQPATFEPIRAELESTALIKVETLEQFNSPYLRFHPTLAYAARPEGVPDPEAAVERFLGVYLAVMRLADSLLRGQQPAAGMELVRREEANLRRALQLAQAGGQRREMSNLADTLRDYLGRAGRNRERNALTAWVRAQLPDDVLDTAACNAICDHAWTLFTQGRAQEAVNQVQALLERLQSEGLAGGEDPNFQIALAYRYLGQIFVNAHRPDLALEPARQAIARFEQMEGEAARSNLSAALGDLANAYSSLGQFDQALEANERALNLYREMKQEREVATNLGRSASILQDAHRYAEAEARYAEAMQAAIVCGDLNLQGTTLQHQGLLLLQREQGHHARAVELFKQAIALFQQAHDPASEMRTCDLLATAEQQRGELEAAEAWYARARQLAGQLHDRAQLAATAQNLGILYQKRAEALPENAPARRTWLEKAVASVQESLEITLENQNQIGAADSYFQLGVLHQKLGDLEAAEQYLLKSIQINEELDLPEVYKDYGILVKIARARGDEKSAAEWQAKFEAKYVEIQRLERGEEAGGPKIDERLMKFLTELAQVCYAVRVQKASLPPEVAEALAQLRDAPPPFPAIDAFLQAAASGAALPPLPPDLPTPIEKLLQALQEALQNS